MIQQWQKNISTTVVSIGLLIFSVCCPSVAPAVDLLQLPAVYSPMASKVLLLDGVDTGKCLIAVGERGHIVFSEDRGLSWSQAKVPVSVTLTAVSFPTPEKGWVVGHDGVVLHSSDGGKEWIKQLEGSQMNQPFYDQVKGLVDHKKAELAMASAQEDRNMETDLENLEFFISDVSAMVEEGSAIPLMDVWFQNEHEGYAVGAFGMIIYTRDGGNSWAPIVNKMPNLNGYHYYAIAQMDEFLFIAGERGLLCRSADNGRTWMNLNPLYEGSLFGIAVSKASSAITVFGMRGNAFRSMDKGNTWDDLAVPTDTSVVGGAYLPDDRLVLMTYSGMILMSSDQGSTFDVHPVQIPGGETVIPIPLDEKYMLILGAKGAIRIPVVGRNDENQ